jgi:ribonuclease D
LYNKITAIIMLVNYYGSLMFILSETKELEEFCASIRLDDFITIDTEFFRETTYYPHLCLIQIASSDKAVIIDALSAEMNLDVLDNILQNKDIVKVFHSAKQDLEILYKLYNKLPKNIFDTQIAASFCGLDDSISYESLVWKILETKIDKSYCVSDWSLRPLMDEQIKYALGDVTYLRKIYLYLLEALERNRTYSWAMEDMKELANVNNIIIDPELAWKKIKNMRGIKVNMVLKKLAAWREAKAQQSNLPRNHYLHEKHLLKLYEVMPVTIKDIKKINYFSHFDEILANEIVYVIENALELQLEEDLGGELPAYSNSYKTSKDVALLKKLLDEKSKEYGISTRLIATSAEIKALCNGDKNTNLFKGWRNEIFTQEALRRI